MYSRFSRSCTAKGSCAGLCRRGPAKVKARKSINFILLLNDKDMDLLHEDEDEELTNKKVMHTVHLFKNYNGFKLHSLPLQL